MGSESLKKGKLNLPKFFCVAIVIIAFLVTLSATLSVSKPIGADYYFHLNITEFLARGDLAGAWNFTITYNQFPYALFLFHFLLAPTVWSGAPLVCAQVLQVLFLPSILAGLIYVVYKYACPRAGVYCGLACLGSWAFMDGALQVRPESLDMLLYPFVLAAVLCGFRWRGVGGVVVAVFSHGLASLAVYFGLFIEKLRVKGWRVPLAVGVLCVLPVVVVSLYFMGGAFNHWGGVPVNENPQEYLFWVDPTFAPYYLGAGLMGVPFIFKRGKTELERLALAGLIGSLVMLPFWADRFLHYASLPLAVLCGVGITRLKDPRLRMVCALVLMDVFIVYVASYFGFSFGVLGKWWNPGD